MKNKKIMTLLNGVDKINEKMKLLESAPHQQSTVKATYDTQQGPITITAAQICKLKQIFPNNHLAQVMKDFEEYMSLPSEILGKRSSKIVISKSSRYLLKIIEQDDINEIMKMIEALFDRFGQIQTNCLVKIYFIFIVEYTISNVKLADRYIVMPNIRANFDKCIKTFDIKGHLELRVIDQDDFVDFKFGKDQNFVSSQELDLLRKFTPKQVRANLIDEIQENIDFLMKYGILDYSLLFSFEQKSIHQQVQGHNLQKNQACRSLRINETTVLKWMIIDYFQIFNEKKKLQNKFKSLFFKSVSSVQPEIYSKRLLDFLKKYLL